MKKNRRSMKKSKNGFANLVLICIISALFILFFNVNFANEQLEVVGHQVSYNDTLWDLASDICDSNENLNIQNVIIEIKEINNLTDSVIYNGQVIYLPVY